MKKILLALGVVCGLGFSTQAQTVSSPESPSGSVEMLPSFPGGNQALQTAVLKNFDTAQLRDRKTGTVIVYFMIDEKGNPYDYQVLKSVNEETDALALAAVKKIKRWTPGRFGTTPRIMGHKVEITL
jgi:TonB family protein